MKLLLATFLLDFSTLAFAAPRPQRSTTSVVLQDGTHASIENGLLTLIGPDGKPAPAPPGHYTTRDGKQLTVEGNGRLTESPNVPPGSGDHPTRPQISGTDRSGANAGNSATSVQQLPSGTQGHVGTPNDMANATKTQDPVLKALYEITVKLQAMESKQMAQLQAIEAKQTALENQMKAFQATALLDKNEIIGDMVKSSVMPSMQSTYLDLLKAINAKTQGLPPFNFPIASEDDPANFWLRLRNDALTARIVAEHERDNGGW